MPFNIFNPYSYLRLLHAAPGAPPVDVYANDRLVASNLAFSQLSSYIRIRPGRYIIEVYPAGNMENPVLRENISIPPRSISTVSVTGQLENLELLNIADPEREPRMNTSYIRIAHFSQDAPTIDARIDNRNLFRNISFNNVTEYEPVNPGTYEINIYVSGTDNRVLQIPYQVLQPGFYYTLYILGLVNGEPTLRGITTIDGLYTLVY